MAKAAVPSLEGWFGVGRKSMLSKGRCEVERVELFIREDASIGNNCLGRFVCEPASCFIEVCDDVGVSGKRADRDKAHGCVWDV